MALTTQRYPKLKRGLYASLEDGDIKFFESVLGSSRVLTQQEDLMGKFFFLKCLHIVIKLNM